METNNWIYFKIGDLFPKIRIEKHPNIPEEYGEIPFVSSSSINNGVSSFCSENPISGNCITVSTNGDCFDAFYHESPIAVSTDVEVLYSKKLNKYNALFICSVLRMEKFKWTYGRKPKMDKVFNTQIKLPYIKKENKNEPDWDYMTDYIKSIWVKGIKTNNDLAPKFDVTKWKMFKYTDVFNDIYKGTAHTSESVQECSCKENNKVLYVTRTDLNNGAVGFVIKDDEMSIEPGNAIVIGDTTATCFYQENEFITGDHIVILRSPMLNKYNGLFITTMVKNEKYRFSYGRAFKKSLIEESSILLPQNEKGNIDWNMMEQFVKSLKFSDII